MHLLHIPVLDSHKELNLNLTFLPIYFSLLSDVISVKAPLDPITYEYIHNSIFCCVSSTSINLFVWQSESGGQPTVLKFIAELPISDDDKDVLCVALAASTDAGYELGFKAALSINTGIKFNDPKLIKLMNDMQPLSSIDINKLANDYCKEMKSYCKKDSEVNKNA